MNPFRRIPASVPSLAIGLLITAFVSLSVHLVMLQAMNVPIPNLTVITPAAVVGLRAVQFFALIVFCALAFGQRPGCAASSWIGVFLLHTMLTEALFRTAFMDGYCTKAFAFMLIDNVPILLNAAFTSALVATAASRLQRTWQWGSAALLIALVRTYISTPVLMLVGTPLRHAFSILSPREEWCHLAHGVDVLAPAYLTYVEPALSAVVAAALVWDRLSPRPMARLAQFSVLILAIKSQLILPWLYPFFTTGPVLESMLSEGQFALEALTLAVLAGLTWQVSHRRADAGRGGAADPTT